MANKDVSFSISAQDKASAELKKVQNALTDMSGSWFDFGTLMKGLPAILGGISFTVIIKDLIDMGVATDAAMRQIAASLPTGVAGLSDLKTAIDNVATSAGLSIDSVRAAAAEIAKLGVSDGGDLTSRLQVAVEFADATGANLQTTAQGVTEVMRVFGTSSADIEQVMANIASATQGKADAEEVFSMLSRAAPQLQALGVDADTATNAIVALIDRGFNARKAGSFITQLDLDGIKQLASEASTSATALGDMRDRAQEVEGGTGRATQALKDQFSVALDNIGTKLLPYVNSGLQMLNNGLDLLVGRNWSQIMGNIAQFGVAGAFMPTAPSGNAPTNWQSPTAFGGSVTSVSDDLPAPAPAARGPLPLTTAQKKTIDDLQVSLAKLNQTSADGVPKWQSFADAIAAWQVKAAASKMGTDEVQADIAALNATLQQLKDNEAAQAFGDLWAKVSEQTGDAVDTMLGKLALEIAALQKHAAVIADPAMKAAYLALIGYYEQLQDASIAFTATLQDSNDHLKLISEDTKQHAQDLGALAVDQAAATDEVAKWTAIVGEATPGTKQYQEAVDELAKSKGVLTDVEKTEVQAVADWMKVNVDASASIEKNRADLLQQADAYAQLAQSIISAAAAVGHFGGEAAGALGGVAALAGSAAKLFSAMGSGDFIGSGGIGAIAGVVTAFSAIATSIEQTSEENAAAAAEFASATITWQNNFNNLIDSLTSTDFQSAQDALTAKFQALMDSAIQNAAAAIQNSPAATFGASGVGILGSKTGTVPGAGTIQDLDAYIAQLTAEQGTGKNVAQDRDLATLLAQMEQLDTQYKAAAAALAILQAEQLKEAEADLNVRNLAAAGQADAAQMAAKMAADAKEMAAAITSYGADSQYVKDLAATQAAEEAETAAAIAAADATQKFSDTMSGLSDSFQVFGTDSADQIAQTVAKLATLSPAFAHLLDGIDLSTTAGLAEFKQRLEDFFTEAEAGGADLDLGTMSITDFIQAILQLVTETDSASGAIETAAQKISDAINQINEDADVMGTGTDTPAYAQNVATAEGFDLSKFDLSTPDGIAAAENYLRGLYTSATDPATKAAIQATIDAIYKIQPAAAATDTGSLATSAASAVSSITAGVTDSVTSAVTSVVTDQTALMLVDLERAQLSTLNKIEQNTRGGSGGSGAAVVINMENNFGADVDQGFADQIVGDLEDALDKAFGHKFDLQQIHVGSVSR